MRAAACRSLKPEVRVRAPRGPLQDQESGVKNRAHDVTAACRLAMAEVWVRLPLGALGNAERGMESGERPLSFRVPHSPFRVRKGPCGAVWSARHSVKVEVAGSNP